MTQSLVITAGRGPAECCQAVAGVLARMHDEAQTLGLTLDVDVTPSRSGPKSAVVVVNGAAAASFAARWVGTIQWRAPSMLRKGHKRANWFIGVFQLDMPRAKELRVARSDVSFETFRAGGPGGQHQNSTDSAVRATHRPTGVTAVAREERSQHRNKSLALSRLQTLLSARTKAEAEDRKSVQNQLHTKLERGNPVRRFVGPKFVEQKGARHD